MKRARLWLVGVWAMGSLVACGGMTQPLSETGGAAGSQASPPVNAGGNGNAGSLCETECVQKVFTGSITSCKLCHGAALRMSLLDLEAPHVTARLKDVPAKHADLPPPMTALDCPVGDKLIDTAFPENSWLLRKVRGQQGSCGTAMPQIPPMLTLSEQECLATYVACVAAP